MTDPDRHPFAAPTASDRSRGGDDAPEPRTDPVDPTTAPDHGGVDLSVVLIAENEADRIEACIESVFAACKTVGSFEVILVDSASTDRTVEVASEYPITILRIPEGVTVSCGAGRYVGDRVARGEMVLHVDGDMALTEAWLPRAIETLGEPDVAGVEGALDESTDTAPRDVDKIGGVMLYDAAALSAVGGFDPYLLGYEDVEVGFRLREAGYRLVRRPEVSAVHDEDPTVSEPVRRWRKGYLTAPGQTIRKWARSPPMLRRLLRRQRYKLALLGWLSLGLVSLASGPLLIGWLLVSTLGFAAVASRRGVRGALQLLLAKAMGLAGLAVGVTTETRPASSYPLASIEVVQEGHVHEGTPAPDRA